MTTPRAGSAARLSEVLRPVVEKTGADLEDVDVSKAGKRSVVRVVVDRDGGVSMDDVADVSRAVSDALDALDELEPGVLGPSYVLEVTSPGVDRPLTLPRHWRRNVSRLVTVVRREGPNVTGRIAAADDDELVLDVDGVECRLPLADVVRGTVQVEFARKGEEEDA
ncbi:MAG: ribosome maturation factor RimP [Actinomycetota bacterium]|jgi:ribosome maturation factor RimP|nr:ribosome maturation factor RimP [Actinomycetota bacterium]